MKTIVFQKAGKLALTKYVNGALTKTQANMALRNGTVQSIQSNFSIKDTELPDGNSDWPMNDYDTGRDGRITVNMSSMSMELVAFLLGVTVDALSNQQMWENDYEIAIPPTSPFSVLLPKTPATGGTTILLTEDATTSAWTKTGAASAVPTISQYTISQNVAIFNSADAGKTVYLTFDWTATTASEMGFAKTGKRPVMECIISGEANSEDESTTYSTNVVVDRCKLIGDINLPEQSREPKGYSFQLKVLRPRGNNKAVRLITA
jgi:hypothetical protein